MGISGQNWQLITSGVESMEVFNEVDKFRRTKLLERLSGLKPEAHFNWIKQQDRSANASPFSMSDRSYGESPPPPLRVKSVQ